MLPRKHDEVATKNEILVGVNSMGGMYSSRVDNHFEK